MILLSESAACYTIIPYQVIQLGSPCTYNQIMYIFLYLICNIFSLLSCLKMLFVYLLSYILSDKVYMTKPVASHENRISLTDVYHVNKEFKKEEKVYNEEVLYFYL